MGTSSMDESAAVQATAQAAAQKADPAGADFAIGLEKVAAITHGIAEQHRGQSLELLAILRLLERLHQEIRDGFFQESLPDNRQALYALLRDIETSGGWPYIHRMKLQALLAHLLPDESTPQERERIPADLANPPHPTEVNPH